MSHPGKSLSSEVKTLLSRSSSILIEISLILENGIEFSNDSSASRKLSENE